MKIIFSLSVLIAIIPGIVFGACQTDKSCNPKSDPLGYGCYEKGEYSYQCNVENFCLGQAPWADSRDYLTTDKQLIAQHDVTKYPDLSKWKAPSFEDIRKVYEQTQNNVLNCSTLKSKYELHKSLIEDYEIPKRSKDILKKTNQAIWKQIKEKKCIESRDGDKVYNYKDLLDSMTYEQCWYNMYLYYYEQNTDNNIGVLWTEKNIGSVSEWSNVVGTYKNKITAERELSYRTMDTALSLYKNHEKTYPSHVLLGVIDNQVDEERHTSNGIVEVLKKLVNLFYNAQVKEEMPA